MTMKGSVSFAGNELMIIVEVVFYTIDKIMAHSDAKKISKCVEMLS